ncbi:MAG TPA: altronate dehydratase family protein [Pyrinomonadaceae bacterium]|nr:altronate dehydratase family protein [Pyrinomonadaceae bacterium]
MRRTIKIHERDNVVIALAPLDADIRIGNGAGEVLTTSEIPRGHKIALTKLEVGRPLIKYGFPIGRATQEINAGDWVHTHNLETMLGDNVEYSYRPSPATYFGPMTPEGVRREAALPRKEFKGYRRTKGTGTRNEIWIINTVACVNNAAERIARQAHEQYATGNIDGIYAFPHPYGCSQLGDDLKATQKVLAGLLNHPNAGGVLVLGLGCENNAIKYFVDQIGGFDPDRVKFLNAQDVEDEVEEGLKLVAQLARYADNFQRELRPVSELIIGMKCGGSDGLSGITANPLVGRITDRLSESGGIAIISEVPEMFGAEQILMNRARDEEVFRSIVEMINGFKDYYRRYDQPIFENPSPGNKEGGITTLEEKSLGAIQKGGQATVTQVLAYGERATEPGLVLLESPGNDGVSSTAESVAGANLILFTTGRGTPLGVPTPTIKISTNTELALKKPKWIDFDAGVILSGAKTLKQSTDDLLDFILRVASGEVRAKNELNGFREITIFKTGVTL